MFQPNWRCLALLLLCSIACHADTTKLRLAFLGDSITDGCLPPDRARSCVGYVDLIAKALPEHFEVINAGVPGTTTWGWSETEHEGHPIGYDTWFAPHLPVDWVVILLGANDVHRKLAFVSREPVEPDLYDERLRRLVARLSADRVGRITLLSPLPQRGASTEAAERLAAYRSVVAKLCAEGPPLECGPQLDGMPASGFGRDGIHPNAAGHAWLARSLLTAWRTAGDLDAAPP